jgi:peptide methionine sulfoxide reductase MsrA
LLLSFAETCSLRCFQILIGSVDPDALKIPAPKGGILTNGKRSLSPTELNRQGPDMGTQYRSVIFYTNEEQKQVALAYIDQLNKAKVFSGPIVTQVVLFDHFYAAEDYHQNFLARHPSYPYIVYNDLPKLRELQRQFPGLYKP